MKWQSRDMDTMEQGKRKKKYIKEKKKKKKKKERSVTYRWVPLVMNKEGAKE